MRLREVNIQPQARVAWVCAQALHSRLTLCDSTDYSPLGSSVHEILQARISCWRGVPTSLLQGIFLIQGSKLCLLCLLHCKQILYLLSDQGSHQACMKQVQNKDSREGR